MRMELLVTIIVVPFVVSVIANLATPALKVWLRSLPEGWSVARTAWMVSRLTELEAWSCRPTTAAIDAINAAAFALLAVVTPASLIITLWAGQGGGELPVTDMVVVLVILMIGLLQLAATLSTLGRARAFASNPGDMLARARAELAKRQHFEAALENSRTRRGLPASRSINLDLTTERCW